jgi:2-polyprenyl-6-methoxyphenol hydroxylase-like FAD-dependent oxidoreductase
MNLNDNGAGLTKYPYMLILEQCKTERLLLDKLISCDGSVEWEKELVDLQQHPDSVTASISHFEKVETITVKYVLAADGARSAVRSILQLPFVGGTYENRFLLGDFHIESNLSKEFISLCVSKKGFAAFFPMHGTDRFRAIGILPDDIPENADAQFEAVAKDVQEQADMPMKISNPEWISTYKLHHRNLGHFQVHRCFFLGDAAHIHSPAGAQGMNTGIQDSFNLGWKLQLVLKGMAIPRLLETYHEERYPFAKWLIHSTDQAFEFVTNQKTYVKWLRLYIFPYLLKGLTQFGAFKKFVFKTISQTCIQYRKSSLSSQSFSSKHSLRAGDRFPEPYFMGEIIASQCADGLFHAYLVGCPAEQERVDHLLHQYLGRQVRIHTLARRPELHTVLTTFGIQKDGLVLVRPDQYVGYCCNTLDLKALTRYLDRYFTSQVAEDEKEEENCPPATPPPTL